MSGRRTSAGGPAPGPVDPTPPAARALTLLAAAALAVMMLWTIADIVLRLLFRWPLAGSVALVETTLVLVALLALPECLGRDDQIKVDVFDHRLGRRGLFALKLVGDLAMLAFILLLAFTMIQPITDAWRFWDLKPDLPVPIVALLGAIEVALVVSAVVLVRKIVRTWRSARPGAAAWSQVRMGEVAGD
ncbi:TRAP transporter small permease [Azospirillum sp. ST 5-10]|uniref:TRAP transporter small permease n=1 Tax=unclassified Azospirillum TaxID=2630922 RepID=UPI003F4A781D